MCLNINRFPIVKYWKQLFELLSPGPDPWDHQFAASPMPQNQSSVQRPWNVFHSVRKAHQRLSWGGGRHNHIPKVSAPANTSQRVLYALFMLIGIKHQKKASLHFSSTWCAHLPPWVLLLLSVCVGNWIKNKLTSFFCLLNFLLCIFHLSSNFENCVPNCLGSCATDHHRRFLWAISCILPRLTLRGLKSIDFFHIFSCHGPDHFFILKQAILLVFWCMSRTEN